MAWNTDRATLKTILGTTLSYKLVPENKNIEDLKTWQNKIYTIRLVGLGEHEMKANEKMIYTAGVEIRTGYIHNDDTQLTTNETNFLTLVETLSTNSLFENFISEPVLRTIDNRHSVGELNFIFGIYGTCD